MSKTIKKAMAKLGLKRQKMTWPEMAIEFIETLRPHSAETPLIRIGGDGDGAYLIPDDLEGLVGCYSPGVAGLSIFEREFANRGMKCFMADYSVDGPAEENKNFFFEKKF